ncbi:alkaline phosphatase family protein [Paenibacillus sp. y28]|uniref:alkaline phosphatase family protein n=1 Tax=Paenibacillus sp. y28 TaxID=3129110 RepID=UPI003018BA0B
MRRNNKTIKKRMLILSSLLLLLGCRSTAGSPPQPQPEMKSYSLSNPQAKPVIIVLIDSLMDEPLIGAIQAGRAPALEYVYTRGQYFPRVVSSFPTMSVTIDSSLMTGSYADQHRIPGLIWYSSPEKRMIFYGNGPKEALKLNQEQVFLDAVYRLNQQHLGKNIRTLHEELADKGKSSASINGIIYRGRTNHVLKLPPLVAWVGKQLPEQLTVSGPALLSYAALAQLDPANKMNARLWDKYGMNDLFSAHDAAYLIREHKLPDVTFVYFPGNDSPTHKKGPSTLDGIANADLALQSILNTFGSWEEALSSATWIVMGDSGQTQVQDDRRAAPVDLTSLLAPYRIAKLTRAMEDTDQIVLAVNERMAYIYVTDPRVSLSDVAGRLQQEEKLDLIAVKDKDNWNIHLKAGLGTTEFSYHPIGPYQDEYGQAWTISGDPGVADITLTGQQVSYGRYPDILARLNGAMHCQEGRFIVVTVKPGYELHSESSPLHSGGAHGSLHEQDSFVPLLIAGTASRPKTLRLVDMKEWILKLADGE